MNMKRFLSMVFVGVGLLALASLAFAYLARPGAAGTSAANPDAVAIQDYSFQPATLQVAVGTTVTWTNHDSVAHTVTGKSGDWGSGLIAQGQQFSYTFAKAGTYEYFCQPHPSMQGRIVVSETTGGATPTPDEATPTAPPANSAQWTEQMRQMMDAMHGSGSFDAMRQWMEERWGPGAFDAMLQNCPHMAGYGATVQPTPAPQSTSAGWNGPTGQPTPAPSSTSPGWNGPSGGMMGGRGMMGGGMMGGWQR